ncbi:MAG: STAS domain-containing protein [Bacteroidota bacterium]
MKLKITEAENGAVIKMDGKMMLGYSANDFHGAILDEIEKNKKHIVVDLSEVQFISCWGIGILMYGYITAVNAGGSFKLAAVPQNIKNELKKIKCDEMLKQYDTVTNAFNA